MWGNSVEIVYRGLFERCALSEFPSLRPEQTQAYLWQHPQLYHHLQWIKEKEIYLYFLHH